MKHYEPTKRVTRSNTFTPTAESYGIEKTRAKKICIVCGKEFEPRVNNQKCCSPECSDVQKVKRAKASYEKHKPQGKKEDLAKANEVARNSGMSYGQYMAEKYRAEQLETIGERKVKKKRKRVCRQA